MERRATGCTLLLEYNERVRDCQENVCLLKLYDVVDSEDWESLFSAKAECMQLFWSFLEELYSVRFSEKPQRNNQDGKQGGQVNIQVSTVNGELTLSGHSKGLSNYTKLKKSVFPDVAVHKSSELKNITRIHSFVYKVNKGTSAYCMKRIRWFAENSFTGELKKMRQGSEHPNIMQLIGVVEAEDGDIEGLLMPFISGPTLDKVNTVTDEERKLWKENITSAIRFLHDRDVVWGDAKPHNILIESSSREPILFDFEGGHTHPYVPAKLSGMKEGDLHALELICTCIDEIPASTQ